MRPVANKNAVAERWIELFALLYLAFRVWKVLDLAAILQGFPSKFAAMTFNVAVGAFLAVILGVIVLAAKHLMAVLQYL